MRTSLLLVHTALIEVIHELAHVGKAMVAAGDLVVPLQTETADEADLAFITRISFVEASHPLLKPGLELGASDLGGARLQRSDRLDLLLTVPHGCMSEEPQQGAHDQADQTRKTEPHADLFQRGI